MTQTKESCGLEFRKFNRFYTKILGFLNEHIYDSPFSLTESRILFEIYNTNHCTATMLQENLELDRGYVSRIIKRFEKENIIKKVKCADDGRNYFLFITDYGQSIYKKLEQKANQQVEYILTNLDVETQQKLVNAMQTIQDILSQQIPHKENRIAIRDYYTSEDVATIFEKQRSFYAETHGWDDSFSAYLEETFQVDIEKIWIAESSGKFAGCVGLVRHDEKTVQLRWFLVDETFRHQGVGTLLLEAFMSYCREMKVERIFLLTVASMDSARKLYQKFGFEISDVQEEKLLWGQKLIEERWDLSL